MSSRSKEIPDVRGGLRPSHDSPGKGLHACTHPVQLLARIGSLRESLVQGCPQLPGGWGQLSSFPSDKVSLGHCLRLDPAGMSGEAEQDEMPGLSPGWELGREAADCKETTAFLLQQVFNTHTLQ